MNLGLFALMALAGALAAVLGMRISRALKRRRRKRKPKPPSDETQ
jgi:hypothetical protein